ncbi:hypothetical protein [Streptomyces sp. NBC_00038]|uniref:hypothetical protein n=1 Tax=Streptomyces sp. NBC_00038 TaxID=2903615 RepID=UPI00225503E1|nr:hypothetical protein [Streptomyces sp. NBC_00038]MCX5559524.1 hypothetical protein [Streptomyces sp. NBC_00038]
MTVAAESFVGRVLAVFSRRSPAFRPPSTVSGQLDGPGSAAATGSDPGRRLVEVSARWTSVPAEKRITHRRELLHLATYLESSATFIEKAGELDLSSDNPFDYTFNRELRSALEQALVIVQDESRALSAPEVVVSLEGLLQDALRLLQVPVDTWEGSSGDEARLFFQELERIVEEAQRLGYRVGAPRGRDPALERELERAQGIVASLFLFADGVAPVNNRKRGRALEHGLRALQRLVGVLDHDAESFDRDRGWHWPHFFIEDFLHIIRSDTYFTFALALDPARSLSLAGDLRDACNNLAETAEGFGGADLSSVDLDGVDLTGIRWDGTTRWPPGWADRIRVSSVEDPPQSGTFIVVAEGGHDFTDPVSPTVMS